MPTLNLTYTTGIVLQAIAEGYRYGFDIMEASGLADGTVYPALRRLEAAGYLISAWEEPSEATAEKRPKRRYYELTPGGQELLREARAKFTRLEWSVPSKDGPEVERA